MWGGIIGRHVFFFVITSVFFDKSSWIGLFMVKVFPSIWNFDHSLPYGLFLRNHLTSDIYWAAVTIPFISHLWKCSHVLLLSSLRFLACSKMRMIDFSIHRVTAFQSLSSFKVTQTALWFPHIKEESCLEYPHSYKLHFQETISSART